jgi:tetratricopeptide (TPR) repeat protein
MSDRFAARTSTITRTTSEDALKRFHRNAGIRTLMVSSIVFISTLLSCTSRETGDVLALAPELRQELVRHLISDDDSALVAYAERVGVRDLIDSYDVLKEALATQSPESFVESAAVLFPPMGRLSDVVDRVYDLPTARYDFTILSMSPTDRALEFLDINTEGEDLYQDGSVEPGVKLARLNSLLAKADSLGFFILDTEIKSWISLTMDEMGRDAEATQYLESAMEDAYRSSNYGKVCQLQGELGMRHLMAGEVDSMKSCYEKAAALARRHRLPVQSARILSFYAFYYKDEGRLSLSSDLFNESVEVCQKYKGGVHEIRFLMNSMRFQAEFGCWEVVSRLLRRAEYLQRELQEQGILRSMRRRHIPVHYALLIRQIEAAYLVSQGKIDEGNAIFEKDESITKGFFLRDFYPRHLLIWGKSLVGSRAYERSIPVIDKGLRVSEAQHQSRYRSQFALLMARALLESGDAAAAGRYMRRFDETYAQLDTVNQAAYQRDRVEVELLRAKMHVASGESVAGLDALAGAFGNLEQSLRNMEPGVYGYLWLGGCGELKQLLVDVTSYDPKLGYGAEIYWHSLSSVLGLGNGGGRNGNRFTTGDDFLAYLRRLAEGAVSRLSSTGGVHLLYDVHNDEVWRWTVSRRGVQRSALASPRPAIEDLVAATRSALERDPGDRNAVTPPGLIRDLHALAEDLLPPELRGDGAAGGAKAPVFVTVDGIVGRVPFAALNVGTADDFVPLVARRDVAYVRCAQPAGRVESKAAQAGRGLILLTSQPAPDLLKRYPMHGPLPGAAAEAEVVASANPDARLYRGEEATKKNLLSHWETAPFVYMATHILRDPETPYVVLIPMAAPGDNLGPDARFLDILDIRRANFERCNVVVLSGCSSGAPYLVKKNAAPSLGDVFADAGARAVVQTFWNIRDDESTRMMGSFVTAWGDSALTNVHALCQAQRAYCRMPEGIRHPFGWAAYSIQTGRL